MTVSVFLARCYNGEKNTTAYSIQLEMNTHYFLCQPNISIYDPSCIEEAPRSLYVTAEWFQTPHGEVLLSIDRAVTAIHTEAAERGGTLTQKQTGNLQYVS